MKYKVGDKVRVKQGLKYGEAYISNAVVTVFAEGMDVDSIEIEDVIDGFYRTHLSDGTEYAYTDEMLDGLVEDEADVSEPTDAELLAAAEMLKANCKNQKDCHKCIFMSNVCCKFEYKTPEEWELPHRKTRIETVLEKFPNAKADEIIDSLCPNTFGLGTNEMSEGCNKTCKACWNAPAESEEE